MTKIQHICRHAETTIQVGDAAVIAVEAVVAVMAAEAGAMAAVEAAVATTTILKVTISTRNFAQTLRMVSYRAEPSGVRSISSCLLSFLLGGAGR